MLSIFFPATPVLSFILWDVSPEISDLFSFGLSIRYYGLLFASGFLFGQLILSKIFKAEGKPEKDIEAVTMYMLVATVVGARLGHCLFYEPDYYLSHPLEILMVWKGGLASHGATVGILTAIYLYSRKKPDQSYLWVLDRIVIVVALGGALIRTGNLMNSEIIGKPTAAPWAFSFVHGSREALEESFSPMLKQLDLQPSGADTVVNGEALSGVRYRFTFFPYKFNEASVPVFLNQHVPEVISRYEDARMNLMVIPEAMNSHSAVLESGEVVVEATFYAIPRHPAQVYEAFSTFLLFLLLLRMWQKHKAGLPEGRSFGWFVVILFSLRFFYEFLKENQVEFEDSLAFNMGQLLSLPLVLAGIWVLWKSYRKKTGKA